MFAPVCSAEEENRIDVQEWHKKGLVAALTDPDQNTVAATLVSESVLWEPPIPAALKTLDEGARQKLVPALEKLLTHSDTDVVKGAAQALSNFQPIKLNTALPLLNSAYGHTDEIGALRFYAHLLSGGAPENEIAIACLGRNHPASCELTNLKPEAAHEHLQTFSKVWDASEKFGDLRSDLADKIGKLAARGNWPAEDLARIKYLKQQFEKYGGAYAAQVNMLRDAINASDRGWWVKRLSYGRLAHALFWLALIFVYPRSPQVQAIFFWNKWVRKFAGLFYIGPLLTWVPFLRNRLLAPFREALLADADLRNFDPERYFADCSVRLKPDGKSEPMDHAIPAIRGQTILFHF